jgi:hypothetical protein
VDDDLDGSPFDATEEQRKGSAAQGWHLKIEQDEIRLHFA